MPARLAEKGGSGRRLYTDGHYRPAVGGSCVVVRLSVLKKAPRAVTKTPSEVIMKLIRPPGCLLQATPVHHQAAKSGGPKATKISRVRR